MQIPLRKNLETCKTAQALLDVVMKRRKQYVLSAGKNNVRRVLAELLKAHEGMSQGDFNALDDKTLTKKKKEMEDAFEQNKIDKESADFVYDKQQEFDAVEASGWDSDSGSGSDDDW
eukprot:m.17287 g.17287  ORF g.17287 m.17287 type:complete len:117 (-) comp8124_c0_seq1:168-518(-)